MTDFLLALLALSASSLVLGLLLIPLAKIAAVRIGLVDKPDNRRKIHAREVPVVGGVAVFMAASMAMLVALLVPSTVQDACLTNWPRLVSIWLACAILCMLGVVDDKRPIRGRQKLLFQLLALAVLMSSGFIVRKLHIFGTDLDLGLLAAPFTILWLLGGINSINLLDGMDGLLGTIGVVLSVAMAAMALLEGQLYTAVIAATLIGALLSFLVFNFPPASIFMGDGGSMPIGLLIGIMSVQVTGRDAPVAWAPFVALAVLTVPMLDTLAAVVRRKMTGRSMFSTDRSHLHHQLLRKGLSPRGALIVVAGLTVASAAGAIASILLGMEWVAIVTPIVLVGLLIGTRYFGYAEFMLVLKQSRVTVMRVIFGQSKGRAQQMEVRLQGSMAWDELWVHLVKRAGQLELVSMCLDVNAPAIHEGYYAFWESFGYSTGEDRGGWLAEIPLESWGPVVGRVVLKGRQLDVEFWRKIGEIALVIKEFETPGLPMAPARPPQAVAQAS